MPSSYFCFCFSEWCYQRPTSVNKHFPYLSEYFFLTTDLDFCLPITSQTQLLIDNLRLEEIEGSEQEATQ